ncbi:MAG: hypothetical protein FJZ90_00880 [Chloroflexi bacterium]|nr:hypothetical protein [Chloroflexota bacterium]
MIKRFALVVLCGLLLVVAAACGAKEEPAPVIVEATFAKGLSDQMQPVEPTDEFTPEETVYLSIKLQGNPSKGVVSVRYTYKDQELTTVSLDLAQVRKEQGTLFVIGGNTLLGYTLTHEEPFPPGDEYAAEVSVNGTPVATYSYKVVGPPVAEAVPAEVVEATFAKGLGPNMEPVDPTSAFPPEGPIHLSVKLRGVPNEGLISARFVYGAQEITTTSLDLAEWYEQKGADLPPGSNMYVGFTLRPDRPFPGSDDYRAEVSLDGSLVGSYAFSIVAPEATPTTAAAAPSAEAIAAEDYTEYVDVTDDSGVLIVAIPVEWDEVDGGPWVVEDKVVGVGLAASADLYAFDNTWSEPGLFLTASRVIAEEMDDAAILAQFDLSEECDSRRHFDDYDDGLYTGQYDIWEGCGLGGARYYVIVAAPEGREYVIVLRIQAVSDADTRAVDKIIESFGVIGELPED